MIHDQFAVILFGGATIYAGVMYLLGILLWPRSK